MQRACHISECVSPGARAPDRRKIRAALRFGRVVKVDGAGVNPSAMRLALRRDPNEAGIRT